MEPRTLSLPALKDLCLSGVVSNVEAIKGRHGFRLLFWCGSSKYAHSLVILGAARGGERFYKSLDSVYDLLAKLQVKRLQVVIAPQESYEPPPEKTPRIGGQRTNPELERLHELKEKDRKTFLTKAERDELKHLSERFSMTR